MQINKIIRTILFIKVHFALLGMFILLSGAMLAQKSMKDAFTVYGEKDGILNMDIYSFAEFENQIFAQSNNTVSIIKGEEIINISIQSKATNALVWQPRFYQINDKLLSLNRQGLFIYDGLKQQFKSVYCSENIVDIAPLKDSLCVVGYKKGVCLAILQNDSIINIDTLEGTKSYYIRRVKYKNNKLFVSTSLGYYEYNWEQSEFRIVDHYLPNLMINDVLTLNDGSVWASTPRNGIYVKKFGQTRFNKLEDTYKLAKDIGKYILGIIEINDEVWIRTPKGIYIFNKITLEFRWLGKPYINGNSIYDVLFDSNSNIWLGGIGTGVNVMFQHNEAFKNVEDWQGVLKSNRINSICIDKNGDIWASSFESEKLFRYNKSSQQLIVYSKAQANWEEVLNARIRKIYCDDDGEIWCGTKHKGLYRLNVNKQEFENVISDTLLNKGLSAIEFIHKDQNNNLIIGQYSKGAYWVDAKNNYEPHKILYYPIRDMVKDGTDILWILKQNAIHKWNGFEVSLFTTVFNKGNANCLSVNDNNLIIGMDGEGLLIINKQDTTINQVINPSGELYNNIMSVEVENSNLWVSSLGGLAVYNLINKSYVSYKSNIYLGCGQYSIRTSLKDTDANIWLGGRNGVQKISTKDYTEPIINSLVTRVLGDDVILNDSVYVLKENANVRLALTSSNLDKYVNVQYQVKMFPLDTTWRDSDYLYDYRGLPSGKYTLKSRASVNGKDYINAPPVYFKVKSSIYKYIIVLILGELLILFLLLFFIRKRKKALIEINNEEEKPTNKVYSLLHIKPNLLEYQYSFVDQTILILENNYFKSNFNIEKFEGELGLGHATFYRKLKVVTDLTAANLLKVYRLNKSKDFLMKKNNVSEAAYASGFNDPKYFGKVFKAHYGISPTEFMSGEK